MNESEGNSSQSEDQEIDESESSEQDSSKSSKTSAPPKDGSAKETQKTLDTPLKSVKSNEDVTKETSKTRLQPKFSTRTEKSGIPLKSEVSSEELTETRPQSKASTRTEKSDIPPKSEKGNDDLTGETSPKTHPLSKAPSRTEKLDIVVKSAKSNEILSQGTSPKTPPYSKPSTRAISASPGGGEGRELSVKEKFSRKKLKDRKYTPKKLKYEILGEDQSGEASSKMPSASEGRIMRKAYTKRHGKKKRRKDKKQNIEIAKRRRKIKKQLKKKAQKLSQNTADSKSTERSMSTLSAVSGTPKPEKLEKEEKAIKKKTLKKKKKKSVKKPKAKRLVKEVSTKPTQFPTSAEVLAKVKQKVAKMKAAGKTVKKKVPKKEKITKPKGHEKEKSSSVETKVEPSPAKKESVAEPHHVTFDASKVKTKEKKPDEVPKKKKRPRKRKKVEPKDSKLSSPASVGSETVEHEEESEGKHSKKKRRAKSPGKEPESEPKSKSKSQTKKGKVKEPKSQEKKSREKSPADTILSSTPSPVRSDTGSITGRQKVKAGRKKKDAKKKTTKSSSASSRTSSQRGSSLSVISNESEGISEEDITISSKKRVKSAQRKSAKKEKIKEKDEKKEPAKSDTSLLVDSVDFKTLSVSSDSVAKEGKEEDVKRRKMRKKIAKKLESESKDSQDISQEELISSSESGIIEEEKPPSKKGKKKAKKKKKQSPAVTLPSDSKVSVVSLKEPSKASISQTVLEEFGEEEELEASPSPQRTSLNFFRDILGLKEKSKKDVRSKRKEEKRHELLAKQKEIDQEMLYAEPIGLYSPKISLTSDEINIIEKVFEDRLIEKSEQRKKRKLELERERSELLRELSDLEDEQSEFEGMTSSETSQLITTAQFLDYLATEEGTMSEPGKPGKVRKRSPRRKSSIRRSSVRRSSFRFKKRGSSEAPTTPGSSPGSSPEPKYRQLTGSRPSTTTSSWFPFISHLKMSIDDVGKKVEDQFKQKGKKKGRKPKKVHKPLQRKYLERTYREPSLTSIEWLEEVYSLISVTTEEGSDEEEDEGFEDDDYIREFQYELPAKHELVLTEEAYPIIDEFRKQVYRIPHIKFNHCALEPYYPDDVDFFNEILSYTRSKTHLYPVIPVELTDHQIVQFLNVDPNPMGAVYIMNAHYRWKAKLPYIFNNRDPTVDDIKLARSVLRIAPLPILTKKGYQMIYIGLKTKSVKNFKIYPCCKLFSIAIEALMIHTGLYAGQVFMLDLKNLTPNHISIFTLATYLDFMKYLMEGLPFKVKRIYLINIEEHIESKLTHVLKPFFSDDVLKLFRFLDYTFPYTLLQIFSVARLPEDLGGNLGSTTVYENIFFNKMYQLGRWFKKEQAQRKGLEVYLDERTDTDAMINDILAGVAWNKPIDLNRPLDASSDDSADTNISECSEVTINPDFHYDSGSSFSLSIDSSSLLSMFNEG